MGNFLEESSTLIVKQVFEVGEIFGFETRNKYKIMNEQGINLGFAAEQGKGLFSFVGRQFLGHWRTFELHFFDTDRRPLMTAHHPFRWYFQCLEVYDQNQTKIGYLERTFSFFSKDFAIYDRNGILQMTVQSPFWKIWTFPFMKNGRQVASISKKWSGLGSELFTDRDNFFISLTDQTLSREQRILVVAAAFHIDMMYFEGKGNGSPLDALSILD